MEVGSKSDILSNCGVLRILCEELELVMMKFDAGRFEGFASKNRYMHSSSSSLLEFGCSSGLPHKLYFHLVSYSLRPQAQAAAFNVSGLPPVSEIFDLLIREDRMSLLIAPPVRYRTTGAFWIDSDRSGHRNENSRLKVIS